MSDVIDWSKAPEGATHFCPLVMSGHWRNLSGNFGMWWHNGEWFNSDLSSSNFKPACAIARPEQQPSTWSGEGLPPVGTVCEWEHEANRGNWHKATINYIGSAYVIVSDLISTEQHYYLRSMKFRPIRTPEQIAADERNDAIAAMVAQSLGRCDSIGAAYLYDAGYRKQ